MAATKFVSQESVDVLTKGINTLDNVLNKLSYLNNLSDALRASQRMQIEADILYKNILEAEKEYSELGEKIAKQKKDAENEVLRMKKEAEDSVQQYKTQQLTVFAAKEEECKEYIASLEKNISVLNSVLEERREKKKKVEEEIGDMIVKSTTAHKEEEDRFEQKMQALVTEYEKKKGKQEAKLEELTKKEIDLNVKIEELRKVFESLREKYK